MSIAWHSTRWLDWCMSKNKKKGIKTNFTDKVEKW